MKNREPHLKKPVCSVVHKVSAGETLYRIARRYGVDYGRLMALNRITNPYNVKPGMEICIPPVSGTDSGSNCAGYYIISEGDTLYRIAKNFGISLESLMAANSDVDPYNMHVGMKLCIPRRNPEPQRPDAQRPGRPSAPGGQQNQRPGIPGQNRPSRPGSGNQQSGGIQVMPRTSESTAAQKELTGETPSESSGTAKQSPATTGAAVMNALSASRQKDSAAARSTADPEKGNTESDSSAIYAEMTAESEIPAPSSAAPAAEISELQTMPSETTNIDTLSVPETKASDSRFRTFVSDTMPDGILYRVEQGETLTDILKKFGICFSALNYSNSSIDLSGDLSGLTLTIPYGDRFCTDPDNQNYIIRKNDTLDNLSARFHIPADQLLRINPMKKPEDFSNTGSRINISDDL